MREHCEQNALTDMLARALTMLIGPSDKASRRVGHALRRSCAQARHRRAAALAPFAAAGQQSARQTAFDSPVALRPSRGRSEHAQILARCSAQGAGTVGPPPSSCVTQRAPALATTSSAEPF